MVGGNLMSAAEFQFDRGLSKEFHEALDHLVDSPDALWLKDLLLHPDIIPAVRKNSLNFYYCGGSIFRLTWTGKGIAAHTHFKYLIRQKQDYIGLGPNDRFEFDPKDCMWSEYKSPTTLKDMMKTASVYAGPEKTGLHALIEGNANESVDIIDVEVNFTREGGGDLSPEEIDNPKRRFDRLDVATLEDKDGAQRLVFHEAKHFTNKELRAGAGKTPPVVEQIQRYRQTIQKYKADITKAYEQVRRDLAALASLRERVASESSYPKSRMLTRHPLLLSSNSFQIDPEPRLIVFGFDQDQKNGDVWKKHYDRLHGEFGLTVYAVGDPKVAKSAFAPAGGK
jgi:hypothetical protein